MALLGSPGNDGGPWKFPQTPAILGLRTGMFPGMLSKGVLGAAM